MKTFKLKHPVTLGTETVSEITLGRIKAKHMRSTGVNAANDAIAYTLALAQKISDQPVAIFDEIDAEDLEAIQEYVGELLGGSPETGAMS